MVIGMYLMQAIAPPPSRHCATSELINNDDLSCLDDVTHIPGLKLFCLRRTRVDAINWSELEGYVDPVEFNNYPNWPYFSQDNM